jgi:phosphoribosylformylglycinamidine synthase subunit PurL
MPFDAATLELHGITPDEYARIEKLMGREPTLTELGMFSVMWSEHCSYKSSRIYLRTLPTTGPRVVQGPGENAGAVDIGDGLAAVFKIESHNHPSFIEPYQGAATGVGGIIRDIFTMGARPIASLNALRFGPLDNPQTRRIFEGVVAGIGGYGNSIGIPTVGGEIAFDESYAANPLVNVLCLGLADRDSLIKGRAEGVGNPVYYVGAKTGRDGIHGATMASATFEEDSADQRPAVQVGDPFMEKLLLEACLEVIKSDALVGIQDMGAAGLTCSTCEMAARAGMGIDIDVMHVPQRETGMTAYEILLSESQERMLLVIKRGREPEVEEIFERWDLHAVQVGTVTNDGLVRVRDHGKVVAEIPTTALTDEAPVYNRPTRRPEYIDAAQKLDASDLKAGAGNATPSRVLLTLLDSPTIASKRWVYRQFDATVRTNTLLLAGRGTPAIRVKGTNRGLAMSVDCNGRFVYLDPKQGAMLAVAEAARNVACAGAVPLGATNNLNFANPQRPEIMWQFAQAVEGMAEACRAFEIPITGGNVSLYNETEGRPILPTPVIGIVGLIEDQTSVVGRVFPRGDHAIVLLGENRGELGGSEYLKTIHGLTRGVPPAVDLTRERALQQLLPALAARKLITSAQDISDGGLAVVLAECCFDTGGQGCEVNLPAASLSAAGIVPIDVATLFGESAGQVIVTAADGKADEIIATAKAAGVPARVIGRTGGESIAIRVDDRLAIDVKVGEAEEIWSTAIARRLVRPAVAAV